MSEKSLGSSPIGYSSSGNDQYNFIPDLGVSPQNKEEEEESVNQSAFVTENEKRKTTSENIHKLFRSSSSKIRKEKTDKTKKKIASYYLEKTLIERLKQLADTHGIYYSTFVSDALKHWIEDHNYEE